MSEVALCEISITSPHETSPYGNTVSTPREKTMSLSHEDLLIIIWRWSVSCSILHYRMSASRNYESSHFCPNSFMHKHTRSIWQYFDFWEIRADQRNKLPRYFKSYLVLFDLAPRRDNLTFLHSLCYFTYFTANCTLLLNRAFIQSHHCSWN